jgi:hypothetical protein
MSRSPRSPFTVPDTIEQKLLEEEKKLEALKLHYLENPLIQLVNPDDNDVLFEVRHWPSLFKEHNIMVGPGLVVHSGLFEYAPTALTDPIDKIPKNQQLEPAEVQKILNNDNKIFNLKDETYQLIDLWRNFENSFSGISDLNMITLSELLDKELRNKYEIQKLLEAKNYVGFVFLDLIKDMQKEVIYFRRRLENTITPEEEIIHWITDSAGHMAIASHLMNPGMLPSERAYVKLHSELAERGHGLHEAKELITLQKAIDYQTAVQEMNFSDKKVKPQTAAHPIVLVHVIKEGEHGLQRLQQLGYGLPPEMTQNSITAKRLFNS